MALSYSAPAMNRNVRLSYEYRLCCGAMIGNWYFRSTDGVSVGFLPGWVTAENVVKHLVNSGYTLIGY